MKTHAPHRAGRRGFTMVELLIALALSGFIGTSVYFVYAGQSKVFYLQENVAQVQAQLRLAMDLIRNDVKRAGYLAATSTQNDNWWCGPRPNPPITAVFATQGDGYVFNPSQNLNVAPDSLRIIGAFSASNSLYSQSVNGNVITLSNDPVYSPGFPATQSEYDRLFAPGALLRILDTSNRYQIQKITSASYLSRTVTVETLNRSSIQGCGPMGTGQGLLVNPVEYVRYRIIDASNTGTGATCGATPEIVGRTTLVRESLAPDGTTVLSTMAVADYAVDFRVSFMMDVAPDNSATPIINPDLNPYDFAGNATVTDVNARPGAVRSVGLFLAIRTPTEEPGFYFRPRQVVNVRGQTGVGPLLSYNLDNDATSSCRVRSLATEVQVRNLAFQQRL